MDTRTYSQNIEEKTAIPVMALIPARGGSKGVPRKNILMLAGKPLIAYSILQAQASKRINRVIVSTDDEEIAGVAREWGAEVPFMRPPEYADDLSPDIDVFRHALTWFRENQDYEPELVVHLRPTGPARHVHLIDEAIDLLTVHPEADAVRSVSVALQTPYKMWRVNPLGFLEPLFRLSGVRDCQSLPRQQLPVAYWQNGYVDVVRPRAILLKHSMWGDCVLPLVLEDPALELDYPENIPTLETALRSLEQAKQANRKTSRRHSV